MKWVKLQQSGDVPIDRSSHTLTAVGDKLYLFSGEHEARIAVDNDVYRYDPKAGVWGRLKTQGNGPTPRIACTAAAVGSQIWVFAGRDSVEMGEGAFDDLYRCVMQGCSCLKRNHVEQQQLPCISYHFWRHGIAIDLGALTFHSSIDTV